MERHVSGYPCGPPTKESTSSNGFPEPPYPTEFDARLDANDTRARYLQSTDAEISSHRNPQRTRKQTAESRHIRPKKLPRQDYPPDAHSDGEGCGIEKRAPERAEMRHTIQRQRLFPDAPEKSDRHG